MPVKNLRDGTIKVQVDNDGGGNAGEVEVTLEEGDLQWTESRPVQMHMDRGTLDHARRNVQDQLVELSFSVMYTDHLDPNSASPTLYEALTQQGAAASWVSQNFDSDDYAVNLEFTVSDPAGGSDEEINFDRFNITSIEFSEGDPYNKLQITGTAPLYWVDFWWKAGMGLNPLIGERGVFSRASTATFVDDDGYLAYARSGEPRTRHHPSMTGAAGLLEAQRTNLLTYSEEFDNAAWATNNVSVTADQKDAFDGYTTADQLTDDGTNDYHYISDGVTGTANANYAMSCHFKDGDAGFGYVIVSQNGTFANRAIAYVDLSDGTVTSYDNGTASVVRAYVETVAEGYRLILVASVGNSATSIDCHIGVSEGGGSLATGSYVGSGKYIYAWGAQFEDDVGFASSYIPTSVYNLDPDGYLDLPGTAANYASTPDAAALDITGDIDIRARIAADDYTPGSAETLLAKWDTAGDERSYLLRITTSGELILSWSTDGTAGNVVNETSSVALTTTNGEITWVRATLDVSTGNVNLYTSDDGENWTALGAVQSSGATSVYSGSAVLAVGAYSNGTTSPFSGKIYRAQVYDGIGGTLAFDADFQDTDQHGATRKTLTEKSSNGATVTIYSTSSTATRVADNLYFPLPAAIATPKEQTWLARFREAGSIIDATGGRIAQIGGPSAGSDPRCCLADTGAGLYSFGHDNGTSNVIAALAAAPSIQDEVELRANLGSDGAVLVGQSIGQAAETSEDDATANALSGAWSAEKIWINSSAGGASQVGFLHIREMIVARRTRTLEELRKVG